MKENQKEMKEYLPLLCISGDEDGVFAGFLVDVGDVLDANDVLVDDLECQCVNMRGTKRRAAVRETEE